jgi:hypothetical protein
MLGVVLLFVSAHAHAHDDATADPNAPRFGLMFRGAMRAQMGATLPLLNVASNAGFALSLSPLIELHEPANSNQVLPSQYWRARVGVASSYGWHAAEQRYQVSFAIEHESDHETAHKYSAPGFLTQNALMLGGYGQWLLGAVRLSVTPTTRLYVVSCTRDRTRCSNFRGDTSVGAQLDVMLDAPGWDIASLVPFMSVSALGILAHQDIRSESHIELHLGMWCTTPRLLLQAFALAYLGNDVGITRAQRVTQLGFGLNISPRWD